MRRLHVVVLDEELPYPMTSGKRIRTFNLLRRLASRHRITYVCHTSANDEENALARAAFQRADIRIVQVPQKVPAKSGIGFPLRLLANLTSPLPYSVATHASPAIRQAVAQLAQQEPIDLWHCEWTPYAQLMRTLLPASTPRPWIVMAHNVESLIWRRYRDTETHPLKRRYIAHQCRKFERFERWVVAHANCTIAVSDEDAELFRTEFGAKRLEVVENGVDIAYFQPTPPQERQPYRILFLGSLDWRPNLDAVGLLLDHIFPQVRAKEPRAELSIVGRNPPQWLRQKHNPAAGIHLTADVADVRPYLAQSGMLAVPLRIGGGSRLKILEALATGLPVVTTRVGVEGLRLEHDRHVSIVESPHQMVDALLAAMRCPKAMQLTALRGRQRVLDCYDWDPLAHKLERIWEQCAFSMPPISSTIIAA